MISRHLYGVCRVVGREAHLICANEKAPPSLTLTTPPPCLRSCPLGVNLPVGSLSLLLRGCGEKLPKVRADIMSHAVPSLTPGWPASRDSETINQNHNSPC